MSHPAPVVTLDGPGGSGKGTISKIIAVRLGWHLLDSGAIYRVLGKAAMDRGLSFSDVSALAGLARALDVEFRINTVGENEVWLDGRLVDSELRTEGCGEAASRVASIPDVRAALLQRQRDFAKAPGLVADGRDMGTVVFPDAGVKIFLTASLEERVSRRYKQLKEKGLDASIGALSREIAARDERDTNRSTAPLKPAADAITVDCSNMDIGEVVDFVMGEISKKFGNTGA